MASCDVQSLLQTAGCFMRLPFAQLLGIQTSLLCQVLQASNPMAVCDVQSLLDSGKCFERLPVTQLLGIQAQLLCEILQGGGTGTDNCLICGDVDPTETPPCTCALAYNRATGAFFYWDSTLTSWISLIT